jgi:hypothetical protein
MRRTTILIDESLDSDVRSLARRLRKPLGAVIREALARYVESQASTTGPTLGFVAIGRSGHSDVAERHEDLLFADSVADAGASSRVRPGASRGRGAKPRKRTAT